MSRELAANLLTTDPGIYRILDSETGRLYIGSAANLRKRWSQHIYRLKRGDHPNPIMQSIWNKDPNRLVFVVVERMHGANLEARLAAEQLLLDEVNAGTNRSCMNVLAIAGSHEGRKRSAETIQRLSAANKGRKFSEETKAKMRAAKLGIPLTAEHRAKIRAKSKGRPGPVFNSETLSKFRKYSAESVTSLRECVRRGVPLSTAAKEIGMSRAAARRIVFGGSYAEI